MKWLLALLAVIALIVTAPLWVVPLFVWTILWPMVKDMKRVLDGKMKFW